MKAARTKAIIWMLLLAISVQFYVIPSVKKCELHSGWPCYVSPSLVVLLPEAATHPSLTRVRNIFQRLGYVTQSYTTADADWDLLWTNLYPFNVGRWNLSYDHIKVNQKLNHFPGNTYLCTKYVLNTFQGGCRHCPKTFLMPQEKQRFLNEIRKDRSDKRLWIQKDLRHRGNQVKAVKDLDLDKKVLIQEFIANQFLVHGHVINIGINVVITSASPLRVYLLEGAWGIRICSEPFNLNNYTDIRTYVTDGGHMESSLIKFKPLERYFRIGYSRQQTLKAHIVSELGKNAEKISDQIYTIVHNVIRRRQNLLKMTLTKERIGSDSNFFEVMRWDFILDENLNAILLEANMSPDLSARDFLSRSKNDQLLYSTISTLGIPQSNRSNKGLRNADIFVDLNICYTGACENCAQKECHLCSQCLSSDLVEMLHVSYTEHINRQGLRRVYPPRKTQSEAAMYDIFKDRGLSRRDRINEAWFNAKCMRDIYWCT